MNSISRPPINRTPAGLLGLVDIKSMGVNPRYMAPEVQTTLDMTSFYMAESRLRRSGLGGITIAAGAFNVYWDTLQVPIGKVWLVEAAWIKAAAALGVGLTLNLGVAIGRLPAAGGGIGDDGVQFVSEMQKWADGDGGILSTVYFQRPFIMAPGMVMGVAANRIVGAASPQLQVCASVVEVAL